MLTESCMQDYRDGGRAIVRAADYAYILPHPGLLQSISNYSITFPYPGMMSESYTIMPHGSATLVFSANESGVRSRLFGPMSKPVCVGHEANLCGLLFIVEFQPAGYYAFSGIPQREMTDVVLDFRDVNSSLCSLLSREIEFSQRLDELIARVDRLFMAHLKPGCYQQGFSQASRMIVDSGGLISVGALSEEVFYSERHLNRLFGEYVGVGTKAFSRLVRVNKAMRLLHRPSSGLLQTCLDTGFYDMPHFIRDFKSICGVTPQEFRDNMSDFYSEIAKF